MFAKNVWILPKVLRSVGNFESQARRLHYLVQNKLQINDLGYFRADGFQKDYYEEDIVFRFCIVRVFPVGEKSSGICSAFGNGRK